MHRISSAPVKKEKNLAVHVRMDGLISTNNIATGRDGSKTVIRQKKSKSSVKEPSYVYKTGGYGFVRQKDLGAPSLLYVKKIVNKTDRSRPSQRYRFPPVRLFYLKLPEPSTEPLSI
jgi:hypothetical protein